MSRLQKLTLLYITNFATLMAFLLPWSLFGQDGVLPFSVIAWHFLLMIPVLCIYAILANLLSENAYFYGAILICMVAFAVTFIALPVASAGRPSLYLIVSVGLTLYVIALAAKLLPRRSGLR